ncbi:MAG TPA: hypothetical protein VHG93_17955 [Longimicrobium sp.]|nr:hypothetical protein [Longimicrobium sp.]
MILESRIRAGLFALTTLAAFTPLQVPLGDRPVAAGAECTTCCSQPGTKCVVCSATCLAVENSYDAGGGACPINET